VPVCVRYGTADGGSKVGCEMLDKAEGSMVLAGAGQQTWVLPNAGAQGYYRFGMTKADLAALGARIGGLADTEQLAYADAVGASFRHGDIDAGDALASLKPLAASKTDEVATAPLGTFGWIWSNLASTDAQRSKLRAWAQDAYLPRLQSLGYHRQAGEADGNSLLRSTLAGFLGMDVKLPAVRAELLKQGDAALKAKADGRLDLAAADPDLLGLALGVAAQEHGKPVVDALIAELPKTSDPALRNAILSGLGSVDDAAQLERIRDFALGKDVKVGEMAALFGGGRDTQAGRDGMWAWAVAHYDQILARTGSFAGGRLPGLMGGGGCSQAEADRLQAFFKPRMEQVSGAARGLAQTTESTVLCAALKQKQDAAAILR
jgi:alanyl aminopeptidase